MGTQEDRSISSGMSFPKWMKNKMNDKFDLNQSAFSPTEYDGSFMVYYRTPTTNQQPTTNQIEVNNTSTSQIIEKNIDYSKHTAPCQKYLKNGNECTTAQQVALYPTGGKIKSSGTDDGFKGEAAKCGSSIIKVAHQMVAGKVIRGFNVEPDNDSAPADDPPEGFNPHLRRGSKSLPASPLSSPKSQKRLNKYFTGAFVTESDKHQGSWMLSTLLSKREPLSHSVDVITEEEAGPSTLKGVAMSGIGLKKADSNVNLPKPAELREMNFWSPTSM